MDDRKKAVSLSGKTPADDPTLYHLEDLPPGGWNKNLENLAAGDR
jgi:hypothetical protein